jgi:hypothetical protein
MNMNVNIDAKKILALAGVFSGGVVTGAVLYRDHKEFRDFFDNKLYPGLISFIEENGLSIFKLIIENVLEEDSTARKLLIALADSIENGNRKERKRIEKELYKYKDELPSMIRKMEEKALDNN